MINMDKFVVVVLCHCRPTKTTTVTTLRNFGYTGKIILLLDNEDPTINQYQELFSDEIIEIFSKDEMLLQTDTMTNERNKNCAVYARNACFFVAKKNGFDYFCQMDDDYTTIPYRYIINTTLYRENDVNLNLVFKYYLEFMDSSEKIGAVAFAEPGDFVGGVCSNLNKRMYLNKCMGSWICFVNRPLKFSGVMNDDVNCYSLYGSRGMLFYTFNFIMIDTPPTQSVSGGMTDIYLQFGTYTKTFYTILCCPSFVKLDIFGGKQYRIHHKFKWENAVPKLISGDFKKHEKV